MLVKMKTDSLFPLVSPGNLGFRLIQANQSWKISDKLLQQLAAEIMLKDQMSHDW